MSRLFDKYKKDVVPALQEELGITNIMAVPRLEKIIVNVGVGDAITNIKLLDAAKAELAQITGQLPGDRAGQEIHLGLQAEEGPADRLLRHAAQPADVRVLRPARQHRPAARPRLPRRPARRPSTAAATTPWGCATS